MSEAKEAIRAERLVKSFGHVVALNGVSMHVSRGETLGILGDNGAGKSTLIKILTGYHQPDAGQVFVDGRPGSSIGIYYERFVDQGDRWRFKWRLFQTHYLGKADISGPLFDNPEWGAPPSMPPLDAPTYDHTGLATKAWSDKK